MIGLTIGPEHDGAVDLSFRCAYSQAIEAAGGAPVLLPPVGAEAMQAIVERLDGLVFPGGADVDPSEYGAPRHPKTQVNAGLDRLELAVAGLAFGMDVPVLGICRGQQLLNVALGGTLMQHLDPRRHPTGRDPIGHELRVQPESHLAEILGTTELQVNSRHHQALDRLGAGLNAVGWAPDGTVEAVESAEHRWLLAVQFHPEDLIGTHVPSQRLFAAFVAECRGRRQAC